MHLWLTLSHTRAYVGSWATGIILPLLRGDREVVLATAGFVVPGLATLAVWPAEAVQAWLGQAVALSVG
ncbi:hypothetical protein Micbo1qcDRAFT_162580, partial [Microdochium bolleyi]